MTMKQPVKTAGENSNDADEAAIRVVIMRPQKKIFAVSISRRLVRRTVRARVLTSGRDRPEAQFKTRNYPVLTRNKKET